MKNIIEKALLGLALLLAIAVGPALTSAGNANQQAIGVKSIQTAVGEDYSVLDPLNRDQLVSVIKCLTDGRGVGLPKCVSRVTQAPATLTASQTANPLRSTNIRISPFNTVSAVIHTFNVRSEGGNAQITSISGSASGTPPTTIHLYDGSTLLKSKAVLAGGQIVFDNLNLLVNKDTTKTLTIKADFAANTPSAGRITMFGITSLTYAKGDGTSATLNLGLWGPSHYLFSAIADIKLASTPTIISQGTNATGTTIALVATFPLRFEAKGGNVVKPTMDDFTVSFNGINSYIATYKSVVVIPNSDIADGSSVSVTVTASANSLTLLQSGIYNASIRAIKWKVGSVVANQTWGLEDFKTPSVAQFNR